LHFVFAGDIVFDDGRNPMERTSIVTVAAIFVRCGCYSMCIRVELEDRAKE